MAARELDKQPEETTMSIYYSTSATAECRAFRVAVGLIDANKIHSTTNSHYEGRPPPQKVRNTHAVGYKGQRVTKRVELIEYRSTGGQSHLPSIIAIDFHIKVSIKHMHVFIPDKQATYCFYESIKKQCRLHP